MSQITKDIQEQIKKIELKTKHDCVGKVLSIADGVASLNGLGKVMYNEMVEFEGGAFGMALNLLEDRTDCVILGDADKIKEGDSAKTTGRLLSVPVGMGLLGRVVDVLGRPLDGKGEIKADEFYPVEIQLRTMSMDFWAAMEHRVSYKKQYDNKEQRVAELLSYSNILEKMEKEFEKYNDHPVEM